MTFLKNKIQYSRVRRVTTTFGVGILKGGIVSNCNAFRIKKELVKT